MNREEESLSSPKPGWRDARASASALAPSMERPGAPAWMAYAACLWALLFAAASFYWAAGGTAGTDTLGGEVKQVPVALVWATGALKVLGGLLALALAQPWGRALPRRPLLALSWAGGIGMTAYGGIPLVVNGLMVAGVLHLGGDVDWTAMRWHVFLWDPWWLIGGLLFGTAAWSYGRRSHVPGARARAGERMLPRASQDQAPTEQ